MEDDSTLHFCWLVDPWKKSREQYLRAWQSAGWRCVLWHSGQLETVPDVPGLELRHVDEVVPGSLIEEVFTYELKHRSHASCADLLRYLLVYTLGGAYCDIDVLPGLNASNILVPQGPVFGSSYPRRLEIRFIRAPKEHPLLLAILKQAVLNEKMFKTKGGYSVLGYVSVMDRTGPVVADSVVEGYAKLRGETIYDYIWNNATFDYTDENRKEGHHLRVKEILQSIPVPSWRTRRW